MNFRFKFSIILVLLGVMTAVMSFRGKNAGRKAPEEILQVILNDDFTLSPDELAAVLVRQDTGFRLLDIRTPERYKEMSLPGAINIPIENFLDKSYAYLFSVASMKTVIYSDDDLLSNQAWMLAMQKGYPNIFMLMGGITAWDSTIMNSAFTGESISPAQNAVFERRYKARRMTNEWNLLPDSLKAGYFSDRFSKERRLVGGC